MNKLVSKNPILRFKEGNKIRKMQNASGGPLWGKSTEDYRPYFGDEGMLEFNWPINNLKNVSGVVINDAILRHNNTPDIVKVETTPGISIEELQKQSNPTFKNRTTKPQKTNNSFYQFGKMGGWNNSIGIGNITDPESVKMIKEMGLSGSAKDIQNKINEEFGSNAVKSDNKWGNLSKAGLKALYDRWKINKPEMSSFLLKIISLLPNLNVKSITPENISMREQIAMDGYKPSDVDLHLVNISNTITNKTPTYVTADRSQTRDWMRTNHINPYSVTGAMRAAARRIRAGQADDNDRLLVKGNEQLYNLLKSYYKKGGLISRNPIERFKTNFR